jgi:hypothetical protein
MNTSINPSDSFFVISDEEIIERAVITGIELYSERLLATSRGAKSTVKVNPELDSKLNAASDFLGLTRQAMIQEAIEYYFRLAIYAKHINPNTIGL